MVKIVRKQIKYIYWWGTWQDGEGGRSQGWIQGQSQASVTCRGPLWSCDSLYLLWPPTYPGKVLELAHFRQDQELFKVASLPGHLYCTRFRREFLYLLPRFIKESLPCIFCFLPPFFLSLPSPLTPFPLFPPFLPTSLLFLYKNLLSTS